MENPKKLKLHFFILLFFLALNFIAFSQQKRCINHVDQYNENSIEIFEQSNIKFNNWKQHKKRASVKEYEIPVVVHVLYKTNAQNISTAQIQSQIDVLNEDYNKLSSWNNTISDFIGIVGDAKITFKLATKDPQGNPTTGITRKQTSKDGFDYTDNEAKKTSKGGVDPWDPTNYLNLWCVNDVTFQGIKNAVLGYAQFPGLAAATDGVVIRYEVFGRIGNLITGYDEGRTATHEVGHWLGLKHLWGLDAQDGCNPNDDDDISDTPLQAASSGGCPLTQVSCGSKDNVQNFMDYSDDACMTMFTLEQVDKMHYTLENIRTNFGVANNNNFDVALNSVSNINGLQCGNSISPSIIIQNKGLQLLTSVKIDIEIDQTNVYSSTTNVNLIQGETSKIDLEGISSSSGNNKTLKITVSKPSQQTDEDDTNNSFESTFNLEPGNKIAFQISTTSLANNMNWIINNTSTEVLSFNDVSTTTSNELQTQEFCLLEDDCYDFIISNAFLEDLCNQYAQFNMANQYQAGEQFVYNGTIYEAKQLIWGSPPDTYAHFYNNLGSCPEVDENDYYTIINKASNEEIAKVKVSEYNSPETTNFCLALTTESQKTAAPKLVAVYPNPFNNLINLETPVQVVKLFDAFGKLIQISHSTQQVNISADLAKGIYFLEIHHKNNIQKEIVLKK